MAFHHRETDQTVLMTMTDSSYSSHCECLSVSGLLSDVGHVVPGDVKATFRGISMIRQRSGGLDSVIVVLCQD